MYSYSNSAFSSFRSCAQILDKANGTRTYKRTNLQQLSLILPNLFQLLLQIAIFNKYLYALTRNFATHTHTQKHFNEWIWIHISVCELFFLYFVSPSDEIFIYFFFFFLIFFIYFAFYLNVCVLYFGCFSN